MLTFSNQLISMFCEIKVVVIVSLLTGGDAVLGAFPLIQGCLANKKYPPPLGPP